MTEDQIIEARNFVEIEAQARAAKAEVAADMLKHPRSRWLRRWTHRLFGWVEAEARREREILEGKRHD